MKSGKLADFFLKKKLGGGGGGGVNGTLTLTPS